PDGYHDHAADGHHAIGAHQHVGELTAHGGNDIGIEDIQAVGGSSVGWHTHHGPSLVMVEKGTVDYWTDQDGGCVNVGHYTTGDAYVVQPYPGHHHLADAPEDVHLVVIYLDLPDTFAAIPSLGMFLDGSDFTPLPPADCPTLRDNHL